MKTINDYAELVKAEHALNKTIAPVEDGANIAGTYTSGKQFIRGGVLYTALTTIAANTAWSSLTLDTDYEVADDLTTQLASVNQTLAINVSDINTALGNEVATRAKVSGHNLLPNKIVSGTYGGAQFTVNADKSVTISQTTEDNVAVSLTDSLKLEAGNYILSGGIDENCVVDIQVDGQYYSSTGEDTSFTVGANSTIGFVRLTIYGARAVSGTFEPMIRLATDANSDYEPYAMTNRELTPYVQVINNRNFLDNPFFTVNQRGGSSYNTTTASGYGLDRWWSIFANITVNDGSITLTRPSGVQYGANLRQAIIEEKALRGKKVTLSIDVEAFSGNCKIGIRKASGMNTGMTLIENKEITHTGITTMTTTLPDDVESSTYPYLLASIETENTEGSYLTIKSVKFEVGEISTLAIDEEPNYAEELLKCQRYFLRLTQASAGFGICNTAGRMDTLFPIPVAMRDIPTATMSGDVGFVCSDGTTKSGMESVSAWGDKPINNIGLFISKTGLTVGLVGRCYITNGAYIDLSADL